MIACKLNSNRYLLVFQTTRRRKLLWIWFRYIMVLMLSNIVTENRRAAVRHFSEFAPCSSHIKFHLANFATYHFDDTKSLANSLWRCYAVICCIFYWKWDKSTFFPNALLKQTRVICWRHSKILISTSNDKRQVWHSVYRASCCNVLMTNEMRNSYNQFYSTVFFSALHVSNESSRS